MAWDLISNIFYQEYIALRKKYYFYNRLNWSNQKHNASCISIFFYRAKFKKCDNKERFLTLNLALNPSVGFSTTAHFIILHHKLIQYARCQSVSHDSIFASNLYYLKRHVIWHHGDLVLYSCFEVFVTDHLIHSLFLQHVKDEQLCMV